MEETQTNILAVIEKKSYRDRNRKHQGLGFEIETLNARI